MFRRSQRIYPCQAKAARPSHLNGLRETFIAKLIYNLRYVDISTNAKKTFSTEDGGEHCILFANFPSSENMLRLVFHHLREYTSRGSIVRQLPYIHALEPERKVASEKSLLRA